MITKKYTVEYTNDPETGKTRLNRRNEGFNLIELLGVLELMRRDIKAQFDGFITPDEITRTVVKDAPQPTQENGMGNPT